MTRPGLSHYSSCIRVRRWPPRQWRRCQPPRPGPSSTVHGVEEAVAAGGALAAGHRAEEHERAQAGSEERAPGFGCCGDRRVEGLRHRRRKVHGRRSYGYRTRQGCRVRNVRPDVMGMFRPLGTAIAVDSSTSPKRGPSFASGTPGTRERESRHCPWFGTRNRFVMSPSRLMERR